MDKNAIKKYAVWARRELIEKVAQKAMQYGIEEGTKPVDDLDSINGVLLSDNEKKQRQALVKKINDEGYSQVIEEIAYTWFNRLIALRFMEVNGYLPSHIRVFTDENNVFRPQILSEALHLDWSCIDKEKVLEMKQNNQNDELFNYLLISQCNDLNSILPGVFQKISDYTELLLPDYLLREGSVIEQMIAIIPEEDWHDQVQILGWLYQYYNTEPKDNVFAALKKNIKVTKENIPAATQIFTPDWIVKYMVDNSLGRLWNEGHPGNALEGLEYYISDGEQSENVQKELERGKEDYKELDPRNIRCIDPCSGSGHVLSYMFDVLVKIYEAYGYSAKEAVEFIVDNNLWGLDIDDRAAQLAYFSVMMKARQYDRRFFTRGVQPHIYSICDSNNIDSELINYFANDDSYILEKTNYIVDVLKNAKEYGSILQLEDIDWSAIDSRLNEVANEENIFSYQVQTCLRPIIEIARSLNQKYHVVVTNPPYMGSNNFNSVLSKYVKEKYAIVKEDLYSCFLERCFEFCLPNYFVAMVTMESWMFNTTFSKFRSKMLGDRTIINMTHMPYLGKGGTSMGISFGTTAFAYKKCHMPEYKGSYNCVRYYETDENDVPYSFPVINEKYNIISQSSFEKLPDNVISYWIKDNILDTFIKEKALSEGFGDARQGLKTSDNNRFLRLWAEIDYSKIGFECKNADEAQKSGCIWFPYNKGGKYRKWYGNDDYVINWSDNGREIKDTVCKRYPYLKGNYSFVVKNESKYFLEQVTWTTLTSGKLSFRYKPEGFLFDGTGSSIFSYDTDVLLYLLGLMNSKVGEYLIGILGQTMSYEVGMISKIPIIYKPSNELKQVIKDCIGICKADWDDYETSWDFKKHPMLNGYNKIEDAYNSWREAVEYRKEQLAEKENWIDMYFSDVYKLPLDNSSEDIYSDYASISIPSKKDAIITFIEYAVGCMFGRYSLDKEGIICTSANLDSDLYTKYVPDSDGIIPICDDEYFPDDIVKRFIDFVGIVYGEQNLTENLEFISRALEGKLSPIENIRNYFINEFYTNHCAMYSAGMGGKRPIYWLFDSGKKNGFKCLIYMHRYQPDTIARIRTDYVHEQQARYRTAIEEMPSRIEKATGSDKVKLTKKMNTLKAQDEEIHSYEEKIHHLADQMISINLDDGVKHNYELFKSVLAKIK